MAVKGKKKKPVTATAAPVAPEQPPVTLDNLHTHPLTPPDMLDTYLKDTAAKIHSSNESVSLDKYNKALEHPNVSSDTLTHLYTTHYKPKPTMSDPTSDSPYAPIEGESTVEDHDRLHSILMHKNAPVSLAEDYLKSTVLSHDTDILKGHQTLSQSKPGINKDLLKQLTIKQLNAKDLDPRRVKSYSGLDTDFYNSLDANLPNFEPESHSLTTQQQQQNNFVKRAHGLKYHGLAITNTHTPESLNQLVHSITAGSHEIHLGSGYYDHSSLTNITKKAIESQGALTQTHLESFYNHNYESSYGPARSAEIMGAVLSHPNIEPSFLARVVQSSALDPIRGNLGNSFHDDVLTAAISNPRLPKETYDAFVSNTTNLTRPDVIKSALNSSHATPEVFQNVLNSTTRKSLVLGHEKCPPQLIEQNYSASDKKTDAARKTLTYPNTSPAILSELVNHTNQSVAIDALKHNNVDEAVVKTALKRRAHQVQEAAMAHPLAPRDLVIDRIKSGSTPVHDLIHKSSARDKLKDPAILGAINETYSDVSPESVKKLSGKNPENFWSVKHWLATTPSIPAAIRNQNVSDLVTGFESSIQPNDNLLRGDDRSHHVKIMNNLAHMGIHEAQQAIIGRPNVLVSTSDLSHKSWDNDSLSQAYDKINETTFNEDHRSKAIQTYSEITSNPNASPELIGKILDNPDFFQAGRGLALSHPEDPDTATPADRAYKDLPDEEKRQKFADLLNHSHENAKIMAIASKQMPKDMWFQAFQGLGSNAQYNFVRNGNINEHLDHNARLKIARMEWMPPGESYPSLPLIPLKSVLENADLNTTDGASLIREFAKSAAGKDINLDKFTQVLPESLDSNVALQHDIAKIILTHPNADYANDIGPAMAIKAASSRYANELAEDSRTGTLTGRTKALGDLVSYLATTPASVSPDQAPTAVANNWISALSSNGKNVRNWAHPDIIKDGKLDFLASMAERGADPATASLLQKTALRHRILSPTLSAQLRFATPEMLQHELSNMPTPEVKNTIDAFLQSDRSYNHQMLDTIVRRIENMSMLSSRDYSRSSDSQQANAKEISDRILKIHGNILASGDLDRHRAAGIQNTTNTLMFKVLSHPGDYTSGGLKPATQKAIVREMVNQVRAASLPDDIKNSLLLNMEQQISDVNKDWVPSNLIGDMAKMAVKNNDISSLIKLAHRSNAPVSVSKHLEKILKQPELLSNDHLMAASDLLIYKTTPTSTVMKVASTGLSRADALAASNDPTAQAASKAMYQTYLHNLSTSVKSGSDTTDIQHNDFIINTLLDRQSILKGMPEATQAGVPDLAASPFITNDQRRRLFLEGDSSLYSSQCDYSDLDQDFINDANVLQASNDGWKLKALMSNISKMSPGTHALITKRIGESAGLSARDKSDWLFKTVSGSNAAPEEIIKMARELGSGTLGAVLHRSATSMTSKQLVDSQWHNLLEPAIKELDDLHEGRTPVQGSAAPYDHAHFGRICESVHNIGRVLAMYPRSDQMADAPQKQIAVDEAVNRTLDVISKSFDGIHKNIDTNKVNAAPIIDNALTAIRSLFSRSDYVSDVHFQREFDSGQSGRIFDAFHSLVSYAENALPTSATDRQEISRSLSGQLPKFFKHTKPADDKWNDIFSKMPEAVYALPYAPVIPQSAIGAMNISKLLDDTNMIEKNQQLIQQVVERSDMRGRAKFLPNMIRDAIKAPQATATFKNTMFQCLIQSCPETLDANSTEEYINSMPPNKKTLEMIAQYGAGGPDMLNKLYDKHGDSPDVGRAVALSPHISDSITEKLLASGDHATKIYLSYNQWLSPVHVEKLADIYNKHHQDDKEFRNGLCMNRNISKETLLKIYDSTKHLYDETKIDANNCHPALKNAAYGLELFEQLKGPKTLAADIPNLDQDKMLYHIDLSPQMDSLRSVMTHLSTNHPAFDKGVTFNEVQKLKAEKKISQKEFDDVKALVFKGKTGSNQVATPEDFVKGIKSASGRGDFSISYSRWGHGQRLGYLQRHMVEGESDKYPANLVVQLNMPKELSDQLREDPKFWSFWRFANDYIVNDLHNSLHPVGPHTVGWARVDTAAGDKGWQVEEYQSDLGYDLISKFDSIVRHASSNMADKEGIYLTPTDAEKYVKKIFKIIDRWQPACRKAIENMAAAHGCKTLYQHGVAVRSCMSGHSSTRPIAVKMSDYYLLGPASSGYEQVDYDKYPTYNPNMLSRAKDWASDKRSITQLIRAGIENDTKLLEKYGLKAFPQEESLEPHMKDLYKHFGIRPPETGEKLDRTKTIEKFFSDLYDGYAKCWKKDLTKKGA